jgi:hypothetical protein
MKSIAHGRYKDCDVSETKIGCDEKAQNQDLGIRLATWNHIWKKLSKMKTQAG